MIDSVILSNLVNQNRAPFDLIKKRAENKWLLNASSNAQLTLKHSKHSESGQLLPKNKIQSNSNSAHKQSTLSFKNFQLLRNFDQRDQSQTKTMSRKETKVFSGGFIPAELKANKPHGNTETSLDWQDSSDREESLSVPRWHKRPPNKGKQMKSPKSPTSSSSTASVADARELIARTKQSNFPKIIFGGSSSPKTTVVKRKSPRIDTPKIETARLTTTTQTESNTEADSPQEKEIWVSRVDPSVCLQEETTHNVEPPTMTISSQLQASHNEMMDEIVATVDKATETEKDMPLFRRKLQRVLGVPFIAAATKKDQNNRPLINFVKKRDWDAIKAYYGQYWHNIRNRLREDCLLIDERIVIPTQLRQTVLDSLHLTHPGLSAMLLDLSHHVWFSHVHRSIVQIAQNCKHCTEQGKNLKPIIGKKHSFQMEPVVETNEEVQLDFAEPFPDEINRDAYILVAIDK